ncbi:hypothetical protein GCM10028807_57940 [Spirosoma daeguense]
MKETKTPTKMLRSQHDEAITNLTMSEKGTVAPIVMVAPLPIGDFVISMNDKTLPETNQTTNARFILQKGRYWVDSEIELVEDRDIDAPFFSQEFEPELIGENLYRIGMRTFYSQGVPLFCELHSDRRYGMLRLYAMSRPDKSTGTYFENRASISFEALNNTTFSDTELIKLTAQDFIDDTFVKMGYSAIFSGRTVSSPGQTS